MKGYKIDLNKISEGYLYSPVFCVAESINKAKSELVKKAKYESMTIIPGHKDITYTNIPVVRYPEADLKYFEGMFISNNEIDEILKKRKREAYFQSIIDDPNITHCYIRKHGSYYLPKACGYTQRLAFAGVYEKSDAVSHGRGCDDLQIIAINADEHNEMIIEEIETLRSRLI